MIVGRQRSSTEDGELVMDWNGSGVEDDVPEGYAEIGSASDPAEDLWNTLMDDSDAM